MKKLSFAAGVALLGPAVFGCATSSADGSGSADSELNADACLPTNECAAPELTTKTRDWRHGFKSTITSALGDPHHRGRDLFVNPGASQMVIGKLAYGLNDKDLEDEDVDVFVQRDCASGWEKLGTARTSSDKKHATVEGVPDNGGRIFFEIPADKRLGPGKHRVRLVVAGDNTSTDMFIDVVPSGTPIFVSDVDGTLTSSENVEFIKLLTGDLPDTHPGAPEALRALTAKGYRAMYLTARPEWLTERTHDFLAKHGFPPGVVHTSPSATGSGIGGSAADFKKSEMALLEGKGLVPIFGFGNMSSDSEAYTPIVDPGHRIFFQIDGAFTGRKIQSYNELLPAFNALPAVCK